MSDIKPENPELQLDAYGQVPHSGKYLDAPESPEREFDKTRLVEAVDQGLISEPEEFQHQADLPVDHPENIPYITTGEQASNKRRLISIITGGLAIVGLGLGATVATGGESQSYDEPTPAEASNSHDENETTGNIDSHDVEPSTDTDDQLQGDITINLGTILPGEEPIEAVRPNGETIEVPKLRSNPDTNPNEFAVSAMALISCYLTTGDEACLSEFSTDSSVQQALRDWRTEEIAPLLANPQNDNLQIVFTDQPENPVSFEQRTAESGEQYIALAGGTLYFMRHNTLAGDHGWQSEVVRSTPNPEGIADQLDLYYTQAGDEVIINRIDWHITPNPNFGS